MFDTEKKMDENRAYRVWVISTLALTIVLMGLFAAVTVYIDPLFHYHPPLRNYEYPLNKERYQNDGITRNFEYDGIITGSSMIMNFMTSEAEEIFGGSFIKVSFSGAYYKEVNDNLKRAYDAGKDIKYVIRSLDYSKLIQDKDDYRGDAHYPRYLYNDNPLDDIEYVLNKSIFIERTMKVIEYTQAGNKTTSFDEYSNWNSYYTFGADTVLSTYTLGEPVEEPVALTDEESEMVCSNIRQNVTELADEHPETTFYLFFPPYSICYWDDLKNKGQVDWRIDAEQLAIEELLQHPNIRLYSFCDNFELVCDLDNYKDRAHYGEWVNSRMLEWMHNDEYRLTEYNYRDYIETIRQFYNSYDYSQLRK